MYSTIFYIIATIFYKSIEIPVEFISKGAASCRLLTMRQPLADLSIKIEECRSMEMQLE